MRCRFSPITRFLCRWKTVGVWVVACLFNASLVFSQQQVVESESNVWEDSATTLVSETVESQSVAIKNFRRTETVCVAPQDEVWIVSARQGCAEGCAATEFETQRLVDSQWQPESFSELANCHQSDPDHVTVIIVHGNNTNHQWALTRGMQFYEKLFGLDSCDRPSVRLVILAWESKKVLPRPCPDYQLKATRAVDVGASMGSLLSDLGGVRPTLVGYSLGVQVVLSALTELAVKERCERCNFDGCQQGFRVALIAPALEADFACGDLALISDNPLINEVEMFNNRHDRILLAARFLNRKRCDDRSIEPSLVGLFEQGRLDADRFHLHDVTHEVHNGHSLINYIRSNTVQSRIRKIVTAAAAHRIDRTVGIDSEPKQMAEVAEVDAAPVETTEDSSFHR